MMMMGDERHVRSNLPERIAASGVIGIRYDPYAALCFNQEFSVSDMFNQHKSFHPPK